MFIASYIFIFKSGSTEGDELDEGDIEGEIEEDGEYDAEGE